MRGVAILNRQSGGLRKIDVDGFAGRLRAAFAEKGHQIVPRLVNGSGLSNALEAAGADASSELLIAAGGDGTLSAAAAVALRTGKVLGVLPGGTMNLVSRSFGLPQNIDEALAVLAAGEEGSIDIATANGRPFLHEFSVGLHPRMVKTRENFDYASRFGKMVASLRALLVVASRPKGFTVAVETDAIDSGHERDRASLVAVSNNLYGEGHLPFADSLEEGVLGLYRVGVLAPRHNLRLTKDMILGKWRENPDVAVSTSTHVTLHFERLPNKPHCIIDGELLPLEPRVALAIHPGALRCLKPRTAEL
mgnify:CR=1 FL=1